jgi:hypothetical protein
MNDEVKTALKGAGLNDEQIAKLENEGLTSIADLTTLTADEVKTITGCGLVTARRVKALVPAGAVADVVIPEGKNPTPNQVNDYASTLGLANPSLLMALVLGNMGGGTGALDGLDLSDMVPIADVVRSYTPKKRNIPYIVLGSVERRLNTPIVVINADGSINGTLTEQYVMELEEGFPPAEDGVYFNDGQPYQIIKVGQDAQSIYDADPLDITRALQKGGMGIGRINWHNVPLTIRQKVYLATETGELNAASEAKVQWLRDNVNAAMDANKLGKEFPRAITRYNDLERAGALPAMRAPMTNRTPRREPIAPPRRRIAPRDLSGYEGGGASSGGGFRDDDR